MAMHAQALDAMAKLQANLKQEQVLQSELTMEFFERVRMPARLSCFFDNPGCSLAPSCMMAPDMHDLNAVHTFRTDPDDHPGGNSVRRPLPLGA